MIGLPVRNGEGFIRDSVDSLLSQTYGDFRLLISDNASTDGTEEICRELQKKDSRVSYRRQGENVGAAPNFNFVFHETQGEFFKWAACDDVCEPEFLARCMAALNADPGAVLSHTYSYWFDADGEISGPAATDSRVGSGRASERLAGAMELRYPDIVWGVMRRDAIAATRLIASFVNSDRYFLGELMLRGRAVVLPEYLFGLRRHDTSFSGEFYRVSRREQLAWFDPRAKLGGLKGRVSTMAHMGGALAASDTIPARERAACAAYLGRRVGWFLKRRITRSLGIADTTAAPGGRTPPRGVAFQAVHAGLPLEPRRMARHAVPLTAHSEAGQ